MLNAGGQTDSLALGSQTLWYGTSTSKFLGRIDTTSSTIVGQLKLPGAAFGLTAAYVWATDRDDELATARGAGTPSAARIPSSSPQSPRPVPESG